MLNAKWFPYGLATVWLICGGILAWAVNSERTPTVQIMYVAIILLSIIIVIVNISSSIALSIGYFDKYWDNGFATLLSFSLFAGSIIKFTTSIEMIIVYTLSLLFGFIYGRRIDRIFHKFIPIISISIFMVLGNLSFVPQEIESPTFVLCAALVASTLRKRVSLPRA